MPALRPARTRVRAAALLIGGAFGAFGLMTSLMLGSAIWTWSSAYHYQAAEGQVLHVAYYTVQGKRRATQRSTLRYRYEAGGARHEGIADSAGTSIHAGQMITVWFDPEQPASSVLTRHFDWILLFLLPFASLFTTIGLSAFCAREDTLTVPARGALVRADPSGYRVLTIFALLMNVFCWPFAGIAAVQLARGEGGAWQLVIGLLPLSALWLARLAYRRHRSGRQLGTGLLEIRPTPPGQLKARVHFQPPLGERCDPALLQIPVQIQIARLKHVKRRGDSQSRIVWTHGLEATLARGSVHADFSAAIPADVVDYAGVKPACWKISVTALNAGMHFRLAPETIRGAPASTT